MSQCICAQPHGRGFQPTVCLLSTILLSTNLWLWPNLWQHDIEGPNQALQPDFPATALFIEELLILSWDDLRCRIDLFHCRFERATQTVSLLERCFRSESEFILGKRETWQQPSLTIKLIRMVSTVFLFRSDTQLAWLKYFPGWGWMQHGMRVEKWSIGPMPTRSVDWKWRIKRSYPFNDSQPLSSTSEEKMSSSSLLQASCPTWNHRTFVSQLLNWPSIKSPMDERSFKQDEMHMTRQWAFRVCLRWSDGMQMRKGFVVPQ
jgi:hypothetical protein